MTPNGTSNTAVVTTTVFDLTAFDDVKLTKTVTLPTQPTTLEEALAAVGNDKGKLLDVIHEGLIAAAKDAARADMTGWNDAETDEAYTGTYADEAKGKLINAAILSLAKMQGFSKSLEPAQKRALKEKAAAFLRSNPAMLAGIQG
jgi:hypothetical protein